jgi:hypothetical protein
MKSLTEGRLISQINLVNNWTEKELSKKFKDQINEARGKFKGLKVKLQEWPETSTSNFFRWLGELK